MFDETEIKGAVRNRYAGVVKGSESCCSDSCCGTPSAAPRNEKIEESLGYAESDLAGVPEGADLGLGCGNPLAMLGLCEGETVLDLGSGAGKDCFIAAKRVGPTGRVIGVDMTPEMVAKARRNAEKAGVTNVEFRLGEIERLPVADDSVDAIISNCVINLVPDKRQVFADAFRVLKPGGRLSVSDMVGDVPPALADSVEAYVDCLSGAVPRDEYLALLGAAGFTDINVTSEQTADDLGLRDEIVAEVVGTSGLSEADVVAAAKTFASIRVEARKPVA